MNPFRILPRNIGDSASLDSESPALLATLPATNLQTVPRGEVFRTNGLASQEIRFTWDSNQRANMVAIRGHNLTTGGTIRAQGYSDTSFSSALFDSTALAAISTAALSTIDADTYRESEFRNLRNWAYYFTEVSTLRGLKLTFEDAANPDGYMQASRLFVGSYFQATYDPPFAGAGMVPGTMTKGMRTDGGSHRVDRGEDYRVLTMSLDFIAASEVKEFLAIARYLNTHRDFWFSLYPGEADAQELYHQGQFRFVDLGPLEPWFPSLHRRTLTMEEC